MLGVKPAEQGYAAIRIAPQSGPHTWAKGSVRTPFGLIQVSWVNDAASGRFTLQATGLGGKKTEVCLPDGSIVVFENKDEIEVIS